MLMVTGGLTKRMLVGRSGEIRSGRPVCSILQLVINKRLWYEKHGFHFNKAGKCLHLLKSKPKYIKKSYLSNISLLCVHINNN